MNSVAFGTTASPTNVTWGVAPFQPAALVLNDPAATGGLKFWNAVDFNGAFRTILVESSTATMSGTLSGGPFGGLIKDGAGTLILSGTNTYGGGTDVSDGTLVLTNADAVAAGTSLAVGAGGTFIFDPTVSGSPLDATSVHVASQVNPVPEPETLTLLAVAGIVAAGVWRRRTKRGN